MVFVDFLEQAMQFAKGHAGDVPVEILGEHRGHGGFRHALVQRLGDLLPSVGAQLDGRLCHNAILSNFGDAGSSVASAKRVNASLSDATRTTR